MFKRYIEILSSEEVESLKKSERALIIKQDAVPGADNIFKVEFATYETEKQYVVELVCESESLFRVIRPNTTIEELCVTYGTTCQRIEIPMNQGL